MATIRFFIQGTKNPSTIYVRLREGTEIDCKAKTKYSINPNDWSAPKEQPKSLRDAEFKSLDSNLTKLKSKILDHLNKSVGNTPINSDWLKDFLHPDKRKGGIPNKLITYFEYYKEQRKNVINPMTLRKLVVKIRMVEAFEKQQGKQYLISEIDEAFKTKFEEFCLGKKYAPNTVATAIKNIKTICYHARRNGIQVNPSLEYLNTKYEKTEKIYLTFEELTRIEKVKLKHDYLDNARDWLLISCDTGQRVSDFLKFTKDKIRYENGKALIEFTQKKTGKIMTVPLSKRVIKILEKREGQFPRSISDQKYNDYIKDVCKEADIKQVIKGSIKDPKTNRKETGNYEKWKLISSHIGRRSFATNHYGLIPTSLLIGATGHSTEKQFLEYIGKTDTQKAMQLAEYF